MNKAQELLSEMDEELTEANLKKGELWLSEPNNKPKMLYKKQSATDQNVLVGVDFGLGHREHNKEDDSILIPVIFVYSVSNVNGYIGGFQGDSFGSHYGFKKLKDFKPSKEVTSKEGEITKLAKRALSIISKN